MNESNVLKLTDYLKTKNKIKTFDRHFFSKKDISYNVHSGAKSLAFILDLFAIVILRQIVITSYQNFLTSYFYQIPTYTKKALLHSTGELTLTLSILLFMAYFVLTPYLFEGKTLGLKVMKLRIVNKNFYEGRDENFLMSLKACLHRANAYVLSILSLGLFTIIPFLTHDKKGLPEIFSQTFIISEDDFNAHLHNHLLNDEIVYIDIESLAA